MTQENKNLMIKLVAFDWNGTILADTQMNLECSNINFEQYGLKPISLLKFRQTFHIPVSEFWLANGGKLKDLKIQSENFHKLYLKKVGGTRTRAGSKEVLTWLKKQNIERIIYSNHTIDDILNQTSRLKITGTFSKILARDLKTDGHSHVRVRTKEIKLQNYVKIRDYKPQEVLSIGDTEEEIEIGKKYGYHTVAITGGYNTTARLKKHHPDFLIHNMLELKNIVKKLNT
jgi:phosphoglycolate phosphatase-like HAD superfamily hydrolase